MNQYIPKMLFIKHVKLKMINCDHITSYCIHYDIVYQNELPTPNVQFFYYTYIEQHWSIDMPGCIYDPK